MKKDKFPNLEELSIQGPNSKNIVESENADILAIKHFKDLIVGSLASSLEDLDHAIKTDNVDLLKNSQEKLHRFRSDLVSVFTILESSILPDEE